MRLLLYDATHHLGGAITSLKALLPLLHEAGIHTEVLAARQDLFGRSAHPLQATVSAATAGLAYMGRELARAGELRRVIQVHRIDAVLANNGPAINAAAYFSGRPVFQYVRGELSSSRLEHFLLKRSAGVFAVGDRVSAQLRRLSINHQTVSEGLCRNTWPTMKHPSTRGVLWAATNTPWKGVSLMTEAWKRLSHEVRNDLGRLTLCHTGPVLGPLHLDRFEAIHHADLDRIRPLHHVFVHTALQPEPFGRSVLEAMAAGLCPIVPDEGTPAKIIDHGVHGIHYRLGCLQSLCEALEFATRNVNACLEMGERACARAKRFDSSITFRPVVDKVLGHSPEEFGVHPGN